MDPLRALLDEVCLEGLDGITLSALWIRLRTRRPAFPLHLEPRAQQYLWSALTYNPHITFHLLPRARPTLQLRDRFTDEDPETGDQELSQPHQDPGWEDPYPVSVVLDDPQGIQGSCLYYREWEDITSRIRTSQNTPILTLEFGERLVMVGSQVMRYRALIGDEGDPELKLGDHSYCILERLGRARWQGEIQRDLHITSFKIEAGKLHYLRKSLDRNGLITMQSYVVRLPSGARQHSILLLLKRTDIRVRCLKLLKPYTRKMIEEDDEDENNDEEGDGPVKRNVQIQARDVERDFLSQAYEMVVAAGSRGISQTALRGMLNVGKLESRMICRILERNNMIKGFMEDEGRQRTTKYISKLFVEKSKLNLQFNKERQRSQQLRVPPPNSPAPHDQQDTPLSQPETGDTLTEEEDPDESQFHHYNASFPEKKPLPKKDMEQSLEEAEVDQKDESLLNLEATPAGDSSSIFYNQSQNPDDTVTIEEVVDSAERRTGHEQHETYRLLKRKNLIIEAVRNLKVIEDMDELELVMYVNELSWKRFIPPLPVHRDFGDGWALTSDVLISLPLSVYVQVIQINYKVDGLEEFLNDPVKQHYLIKFLPSDIKTQLLHRRKYFYSFYENMQRLCFMGLLQFGPVEKFMDKDQGFFYLKKHATIVDTTVCEPHYNLAIETRPFDRRRYTFNSLQDVENYWFDLLCVCLNTPLGVIRPRSRGEDREADEQDVTAGPIRYESLQYTLRGSCEVMDDGVTPGDGQGAGGLDSTFFSHLKRNWLWTTHLLNKPKRAESQTVRLRNFLSKHTYPKSVCAGQKLKRKRQKKESSKPPSKKKRKGNPRLTTHPYLYLLHFYSGVTRFLCAVASVRKRTPCQDETDRNALMRMTRQRVTWSHLEDSILMLCRVASHFLNRKIKKPFVAWNVVRDILHAELELSLDKTSLSVGRRSRYIMKNPQTQLNYSVEDIHSLVLNNLIQSTLVLSSSQMKSCQAFQSFSLYSRYKAEVLQQVFIDCKKRGLVNRRRANKILGPKKNRAVPFMPMSYQLSQHYYRYFTWRFPSTLCNELYDLLEALREKGGVDRPNTFSFQRDKEAETDEGRLQNAPGGASLCCLSLMTLGLLTVDVSIPQQVVVVDSTLVDNDVELDEDDEDEGDYERRGRVEVKARQASHTNYLLIRGYFVPGIISLRNINSTDHIAINSCTVRIKLRHTPAHTLFKETGESIDGALSLVTQSSTLSLPPSFSRLLKQRKGECGRSFVDRCVSALGYSSADVEAVQTLRAAVQEWAEFGTERLELCRRFTYLEQQEHGRTRTLQQYIQDMIDGEELLEVGGLSSRLVCVKSSAPWLLKCPTEVNKDMSQNLALSKSRKRSMPFRSSHSRLSGLPPTKRVARETVALENIAMAMSSSVSNVSGTSESGTSTPGSSVFKMFPNVFGDRYSYSLPWFSLSLRDLSFVARPWRIVDGSLNRPVCKGMLEALLLHIMTNPAIPEPALLNHYSGVLQPVVILDLLQVLMELGCVKRRCAEIQPKVSLFSRPRAPVVRSPGEVSVTEDVVVFYEPTVDCSLRLSQLFPHESNWNKWVQLCVR
uniref:General transcription factor IIIC subunit 1 n=1 Tax=Astyanax mexicanus TaxID=7994 RepID=A0A8B9J4B0_ASTMX